MEAKDTVMLDDCPLCDGTGEVLNRKVRAMGYTLADGESIDEILVPCPLCERVKAQAEISFKAGIREVVKDIVKLMDCRLAPKTFAVKICDYCEAKLKEWGIK